LGKKGKKGASADCKLIQYIERRKRKEVEKERKGEPVSYGADNCANNNPLEPVESSRS